MSSSAIITTTELNLHSAIDNRKVIKKNSDSINTILTRLEQLEEIVKKDSYYLNTNKNHIDSLINDKDKIDSLVEQEEEISEITTVGLVPSDELNN